MVTYHFIGAALAVFTLVAAVWLILGASKIEKLIAAEKNASEDE